MSFRIHRALIFCIVITLSLLVVYTPQAAAATVSIPITVKGMPSSVQVSVIVDGSQQGTIPGGGTKSFKVDKSKAHTFQVDSEIKGHCSSYENREVCSRHKCENSVWNLDVVSTQNCQTVPVCYEVWYCDPWNPGWCWWDYYCNYEQQCWTSTELTDKGHTFEFYTEHEVAVSDVHGQNVDNWVRDGGSITLSAQQSVATIDESDVKEKDVFQAWIVNGARMTSRDLPLKIDKPYYAKAEYATETQVRVKVTSDYGNPTVDNPDGWYMKGHEATVSIEKELPADGVMGALGGRRIFVAWRSPQGVESKEPTFTFSVQQPTTLRAEWRADDSMPITILSALGIIIIAALAVFVLYSRGVFKSKAAKAEPTELEKAKAEIERLKQEQEERPAKRRLARKKKPPPPAAETTST
jgi:hypothetical protein